MDNEKKRNLENTTQEIEKGKIHVVIDIIDYVKDAVLSRTILRKSTGNVTLSAFDAGEELGEKITPFDNYVQIIDGAAEVFIDHQKFDIKIGEAIVIPAHSSVSFMAAKQFKMILTVIKSGYEE